MSMRSLKESLGARSRSIRLSLLILVGLALVAWGAMVPGAYDLVSLLRIAALILGSVLIALLLYSALRRPDPSPARLTSAEGREIIETLQKSIAKINELDRTNHWARPAYFSFVGLLSLRAFHAANHLAELSIHVDDVEPPELPLVLSRPGDAADVLLARMIDHLQRDDRYYAVSNAQIWKTLTKFLEAQETAVKRGVTIRRVFVIDHDSDEIVPVGEVSNTIARHDLFTRTWQSSHGGRYEMRAVSAENYRRAAPELFRMLHFGVFYPSAKRIPAVAFRVVRNDLSEFRVSTAGKTSPYIAEFEALWQVAKPLEDPEIRYFLRLHLLRRMNVGGRYLAVCRTHGWDERRRQKFHEECIEIARSRGLQLQRLFVWSEEDSAEAVMELLRREKERKVSSGGHYDWKISTAALLSTSDGFSLVTFDDRDEPAYLDGADLIAPDPGPLTAETFDSLWTATKLDDELRKKLGDRASEVT
jgi:hypothetical protein